MKEKSEEEIADLRETLVQAGFEELKDSQSVDAFLDRPGISLVVVNSTCGCAGPAIRQGVLDGLSGLDQVDHLGTVFAGMDEEATEELRDQTPQMEPSSPAVYVFDNGSPVEYIPRKFTMKHQYDHGKVTERVEEIFSENISTRTEERAGTTP